MKPDGSPLSWAIFFCGTKRLLWTMHHDGTEYEGKGAMILDWIFYHDVLCKFSISHWKQRGPDQIKLAGQAKIISKAAFSPLRQVVSLFIACIRLVRAAERVC